MPWLKKNLSLVIAGVVALVLLGGSGYFLYGKIRKAAEVKAALEAQSQELERLNRLNPHPGNNQINNIEAARKQAEQLRQLLEEFKSTFARFEYPSNLSSGEFSARLAQMIADLTRQARRTGIRLSTNFSFGFAGIRYELSIDPKELPIHTRDLVHVHEIAQALINARVLTIDEIKRPALPKKEDSSGGVTTTTSTSTSSYGQDNAAADYWERQPVTNELAVLYPYSVTFAAFTPELGRFLYELSRNPHCIIPKNVAVDTQGSPLLQSGGMMTPYGPMTGMPAGGMGVDPGTAARYGMPAGGGGMGAAARYGIPEMAGMGMGMPGMGRGPIIRGNKTILLEERPRRVRAWLYVVVPLTEEEKAGGFFAPPPAAPDAGMMDRYGMGAMDPTLMR